MNAFHFTFARREDRHGTWQLQHRLYIDRPSSEVADEIGNVYSIDSTCLEIIDESQKRIQMIGQGWVLGLAFATLSFLGSAMIISGFKNDSPEVVGRPGYWPAMLIGLIMMASATGFFGFIAGESMRRNLFTLKRRPIRLNRRTHRIYAMRTKRGDGVWEVPWNNEEFFCVGVSKKGGLSRSYEMYDIRHYKLDADGNVVRAFVLGQQMFTLEQAQQQWEYYRRYMQDGPANLPEPKFFWAPREGFWEGFKICRGDLRSAGDLIFLPMILLDAAFRWLTLVTCSDPVWPPEIEAACRPTPNDPYARPHADEFIGVPNGPDARPGNEDGNHHV
ncbi:DUF6708 domain-containing protein [Cupriavidus necator]